MDEEKEYFMKNKLFQTGAILFLGLIFACFLQRAIEAEDVASFWNVTLIPMLVYCSLLYVLAWKTYSRFLADLFRVEESYASRLDFYSYLPTLLLLQYYHFLPYTEDLFEQKLLELTLACVCTVKAAQFGFLLFKKRRLAAGAFFQPVTVVLLLSIVVLTVVFIRTYDYLLYKTVEPHIVVKPTEEISINNEFRRVLYSPTPYLPGPRRIEKRATLPENAHMSVGLAIARNSWFQSETGVEFRISIRRDGFEKKVFSRYVDPLENPEDRGWIDEVIDLSEYSGQEVTLVFETEVPYSETASLWKILKSSFGVTRWYNIGKYGNIVEAVWSAPTIFNKENEAGPNVILISFDTLSALHLSCYGHEFDTTPNLDRLASEGVLFKRCVAQSTWTLPSHISLFTGQNCGTHGVVSGKYRLDDSFVTLAEVFRDYGYQTAAITEGGNVHSQFGFGQGFDTYTNGPLHGVGPTFSKVHQWLEQRRTGKFFLFVHTYETHAVYNKRQPYYSRFGQEGYQGLMRGDLRFLIIPTRWRYYLRAEDLEELSALYDSEVSYIDYHFKNLMRKLETLGLSDKTTIIVTSDHGEGFGEHYYFGHGNTLYDELLLVPLIMKGPNLPNGLVIEQQVRSIDIMPTALELHQLPVPEGLDGVSLLPLIKGRQLSVPPAISEVDDLTYGAPKKSIRTEKAKLILAEGQELYALGHDPQESADLSHTEHSMAGRLQKQLFESLKVSEQKKVRIVGKQTQRVKMDRDLKEQLEALGYIE